MLFSCINYVLVLDKTKILENGIHDPTLSFTSKDMVIFFKIMKNTKRRNSLMVGSPSYVSKHIPSSPVYDIIKYQNDVKSKRLS